MATTLWTRLLLMSVKCNRFLPLEAIFSLFLVRTWYLNLTYNDKSVMVKTLNSKHIFKKLVL